MTGLTGTTRLDDGPPAGGVGVRYRLAALAAAASAGYLLVTVPAADPGTPGHLLAVRLLVAAGLVVVAVTAVRVGRRARMRDVEGVR